MSDNKLAIQKNLVYLSYWKREQPAIKRKPLSYTRRRLDQSLQRVPWKEDFKPICSEVPSSLGMCLYSPKATSREASEPKRRKKINS